ncbi:MAG: glycosyltransferase family 2 protein [Bacteroidetes bacterium]|nr:MAG: glycosyltransferase family 2 protein [Bacteroidota bacterium]
MEKLDVTLLIPCYNALAYLPALVQNIEACLQKYSFAVLVIDDGSTDGSLAYLQSWQNEFVTLLKNEENKGLIHTLNRGLERINTKYIARLDADDLMFLDRLKTQVTYMDKHEDVVLCGSWFVSFGNDVEEISKNPVEDEELHVALLFRCPFLHSSVIMRNSVLKKNALLYEKKYLHAEDYALWIALQKFGKIVNLPQVLTKRREHTHQITQQYAQGMKATTLTIYAQQLQKIGILPTEQELEMHYALTRSAPETPTLAYLQNIDAWLCKIQQANAQYKAYPEPALTHYLRELWLRHMAGKAGVGKYFYRLFAQSPLSPYKDYTSWGKTKFWVKYWLSDR